jgi:hypothetical protein
MTGSHNSDHRRPVREIVLWLVISLFALLMFGLIFVLLVRSGFFDIHKPINDSQYKTLWIFIGSALGTVATYIGILLTHSHNRASLERQNLETVVQGLKLISTRKGNYATKGRVAGSLAALVHLGHPVIAMRVLSTAWDDGAVDLATAVWLINEVLTTGSESSRFEASHLLCKHAADLCSTKTGAEGEFEWPRVLREKWPIDVPKSGRFELLFAIAGVLLSRDKTWWNNDDDWALVLLDEAMRKDPDLLLQWCSSRLLRPVIDGYVIPGYRRDDIRLRWRDGYKYLVDIQKDIETFRKTNKGARTTATTNALVERLEAWASLKEAQSKQLANRSELSSIAMTIRQWSHRGQRRAGALWL